jgi:hypothetical protein
MQVPLKTSYDTDFTKKVEQVLREAQKPKVGMTRAELLKIFTTEGGLSSRTWRRYVSQRCPYIKLDVEFAPVGRRVGVGDESRRDKITKISPPFLEWSIMD